jgi:hypothetical protein
VKILTNGKLPRDKAYHIMHVKKASTMASSPLRSSTTKKKSDHQLGNLLSIQNRLICYDGKKPASNDEEEEKIAEFELALKEMNVTDMSEPEQTLFIKNYNSCYQRLNASTAPRKTYRLTMVLTILQLVSYSY